MGLVYIKFVIQYMRYIFILHTFCVTQLIDPPTQNHHCVNSYNYIRDISKNLKNEKKNTNICEYLINQIQTF